MSTHLQRLRRLHALVEFGWIGATKRLLIGLKKRGVKLDRWGDESGYKPFFRTIQVPAKRHGGSHAGKPVFDLWHEAGHDLTRNMKVVQDAPAHPGLRRLRPDRVAGSERAANRAAIRAMGRFGGGEGMLGDYRGYAGKHYKTYTSTKNLPHLRRVMRSVPKNAFSP